MGVPVQSAQTEIVYAVNGAPLADVDIAPPLLATLTIGAMRKLPPIAEPPAADVFGRAGALFAEACLDGLSPDDYCDYQALAAGVPVSVARRSLAEIAGACARIGSRVEAEKPRGVADKVRPGAIEGVWVRRGDILGVVAPGNNPGVHVQWILAAALGYRLVVKPGTKDPFTPARIFAALLRAGCDASQLCLLPGGHQTGNAVVEEADLSLVFGGDGAAARYAGDRNVIMRGPGRSKLLLNGPLTEAALDTICTSVAYDAGMRCTNASAVFTEADPDVVADAIAERLAQLTAAPPLSASAQLPVLPIDQARAIREFLDARMDGATDVVARYIAEPLADLGDGSAALRPAVLRCDRADHAGARIELPFPCVWVVPWQRASGLAPLGETLSLTILHEDAELASRALHHPKIRKVLMGALPTFSAGDTSPHDGYLAQDLMEARGFGVGTTFATDAVAVPAPEASLA